MRVLFVTSTKSAGAEVAYPLILFRRAISKRGIELKILHEIPSTSRKIADVIIIATPYWRDKFPSNTSFRKVANNLLYKDFELSYKIAHKVVFFETADSTSSHFFDLLPCVDLMLKWQILRDREYYLSKEYEKKSRVWLNEPQAEVPRASASQLAKLQVGWNLAFRNYSLLRAGGRHFHWRGITWHPRYTSVDQIRDILTSFRGGFSGSRNEHRRPAVEALQRMRHPDVILGPPIRRRLYLNEIARSKATVSPFGYGEPCYRDMECFINGSILVKPSMEHCDTFPNVYLPHKTYVPVRWDFEDLETIINKIDNEYEKFTKIARQGQRLYRDYLDNPDHFVNHFIDILESLYTKS